MMLAFGISSALLHAAKTGEGHVVDCAMTDGSALLAAMSYGYHAAGKLEDRARANLLNGVAHFYDTYACSDGKFISIGLIKPQFYNLLRKATGFDDHSDFDEQLNRAMWEPAEAKLTELFATKTPAEWCALMEME